MTPYYDHGGITIYHGDCREVVGEIDCEELDCAIVDPPYGATSLDWDREMPDILESVVLFALSPSGSAWVFGQMKNFMGRKPAGWRYAQDIVWQKQNGTNFHNDRFKRVHEHVVQFYMSRTPWASVYKNPQFTHDATNRTVRRKQKPKHMGAIDGSPYISNDGGPRLCRSVIRFRNCHGFAENETQKPVGLLKTLIDYSCPPGGMVFDPTMGAGSTLVAAKELGRRALGIEIRESQCEVAANRMAQEVLEFA